MESELKGWYPGRVSDVERSLSPEIGPVPGRAINVSIWRRRDLDWHPITYIVNDERGELAGGADG
jgi:hypothetical protein